MGDLSEHEQRVALLAERAGSQPPEDYEQLLVWVGEQAASLEQLPEGERAGVMAVLDGVDLIHRQGLERMVDRVRLLGGRGFLERLTEDPTVRALLDLYDLAPAQAQVEQARARREPLLQIGLVPPTIEEQP